MILLLRQGRFHNKLFTPIATQQVAATERAIESYSKVEPSG